MVTVLEILVTNLHYLIKLASGNNIQKIEIQSPSLSHQHHCHQTYPEHKPYSYDTVELKPNEKIWPSEDSFSNDHARFYLKFGIEFEYLNQISARVESSDRQLGSNFRTILNFRFSTHLYLIELVIFKTCLPGVGRYHTYQNRKNSAKLAQKDLKTDILWQIWVFSSRRPLEHLALIGIFFKKIVLRQSPIYSCCVNPIKEHISNSWIHLMILWMSLKSF